MYVLTQDCGCPSDTFAWRPSDSIDFMGNVHSEQSSLPVQVSVVVPSKGNKVLKRKFVKEAPSMTVSVERFFEEHIRPNLPAPTDGQACGGVARVSVTLRGSDDEVDVDSVLDPVHMYTQMGLSKVVFYVEQATLNGDNNSSSFGNVQTVFNSLVREPTVSLPTWMHAGRPALSKLFADLRQRFEQEKLGFAGAADLKLATEWMLMIVHVLYKLSPLHDKLKRRGHPVPIAFDFSKGANDYKQKGKAQPLLTQEFLRDVCELS